VVTVSKVEKSDLRGLLTRHTKSEIYMDRRSRSDSSSGGALWKKKGQSDLVRPRGKPRTHRSLTKFERRVQSNQKQTMAMKRGGVLSSYRGMFPGGAMNQGL